MMRRLEEMSVVRCVDAVQTRVWPGACAHCRIVRKAQVGSVGRLLV